MIGNASRPWPRKVWSARLGGVLALFFAAAAFAAPDVSVSLMVNPGPATYAPGGSKSFEATISNTAAADAVSGLAIALNAPTGSTVSAVGCAVTAAGTGTPETACGSKDESQAPVWYPGAALAKGGAIKVTFTVTFPAGLAGTATVSASAARTTSPIVDATDSVDLISPANLGVAVSKYDGGTDPAAPGTTGIPEASPTRCPGDGSDDYTPGCISRYTVRATNAGGGNVDDAVLNIGLAQAGTHTALARWACFVSGTATCPEGALPKPSWCPAAASVCGTGAIANKPVDLRASAGLTFTLVLVHGSGDLAASQGVAASIQPSDTAGSPDNTQNNNASSLTRDLLRKTQITIRKLARDLDGNAITQPIDAGTAFEYWIDVKNAGPSDLGNGLGTNEEQAQWPHLALGDDFDQDLRGVTIAAGVCEVNGDGPPCWRYCTSTLDSPVAGDDGVVEPDECSAGQLSEGRDDFSNKALRLKANTEIRLLTRVRAVAKVYGYDVSNEATVALVGCPESGAPAGCSDVAVDGDMPASDTATVTVKAQNPYQLEVAVTTPDAPDPPQPGLERTWRITVSNPEGVVSEQGAVLSTFPIYAQTPGTAPGLIPGSVSWQCQAQGNACCNTSGQCGLSAPTPPVVDVALNQQHVRIAPGASVTYTVTGRIDPRSPHGADLVFAATAVHSGDTGAGPFQGSASLTMQRRAALRLQKKLTNSTPDSGGYLAEYEVRIGNTGPSYAPVKLTDPFSGTSPETFDWDGASWECSVEPAERFEDGGIHSQCDAVVDMSCGEGIEACGEGPVTDAGTEAGLAPGAELVYRITAPVPAANLPQNGQVTNVARVAGAAGPHDIEAPVEPIVNPVAASLTSYLWADVALRVSKSDGLDVAHPGTAHQYAITVVNEGRDDAFGVTVRDQVPQALQDVSWTCSAQSPVPGDLAVGEGPDGAPMSAGELPFHAVAASGDGSHIYALGNTLESSARGTLYAFYRNPVPGLGYGVVAAGPIDVETEGVDDSDDSGSTVEGLSGAVDLALSSDGRALYVLGPGGLLLFTRTINPLNPAYGGLSFGGRLALTGIIASPQRLVVSATHVYVSGSEGKVAAFRRDPSTHATTLLATYAAAEGVPAGAGPLAISADGGYLFVASGSSSAVARFAIRPAGDGANAGRLLPDGTPLGAAVDGYRNIRDIALAANGTDLYLLAGNTATSRPRIGYLRVQGAALTATATYPAPAGEDDDPAKQVLQYATRIALAPDGEHLIGVGPSLVFSLRRSPYTGGLSGRILEGGDAGFEQVLHQAPSESGSPESLIDQTVALAVSADNRHVFLVSSRTQGTSNGTLLALTRRAPDPVLGFVEHDAQGDALPGDTAETIANLTAPTDVIVSDTGRHVYAVSLQDSAISLFDRRLSTGVVPVPEGQHLVWRRSWRNGEEGITGMARPERAMLTPDGRFLFVTSLDNDALAVFRRDAQSGELTFLQSFRNGVGGVSGLLGAAGMAASDRHLYVAASYDGAIGRFRYNVPTDTWAYDGVLRGGDGVTGLTGIRDLALSQNGEQLFGVAATANTVLAFDRNSGSGALAFRQSLSLGANQRPMALAVSPDDAHVYVAAQNSSSVHVLQRVLDPTSPAFGTLRRIGGVSNGSGGVSGMVWPRDVAVSADGRQVYVVAQTGNSLLGFSRYDSPGNVNFGLIEPLETRTDEVDGVRGLGSPYAVAVSPSGGHIYVAGFDSNAVASFFVGSASSCSAAGVGNIDDSVTIRAGGAVSYVVGSTIRPDAVGTLSNTVEVRLPPGPNEDQGVNVCSDGGGAEDSVCTDETELRTSAGLALTKTDNQATVVPGTWVTYDITVRNDGPGNVTGLDDPSRAAVNDLFDCSFDPDGEGAQPPQDCFVRSSIEWTCAATGSGALDFVGATFANQNPAGEPHLSGVSGLALVGATHLAAASVSDDAVVFFRRDPLTGALGYESEIVAGPSLPLAGARAVATSADGARLYVASRVSDSLSVFDLAVNAGTGNLTATLRASAVGTAIDGLDQALHVIVLPAAAPGLDHVYVAAANSHAVTAFGYEAATGTLAHLGTLFDGQGGVSGLTDVEYLVASPDGRHVYALSGSGASVALFDRDAANGGLSFRSRSTGAQLGVPLEGVSSGSFDAAGRYLYLTASTANRIVVLKRENDPGAGTGVFGNLALASSIGQAQAGAQAIGNPRRALVSPDGQHLYIASQGSGAVAWFSIHPQSGALGYLGVRNDGSAGVAGLAGATGLAFDPQLGQLYVAGTLDQAIAQFSRQADSWCPPSGSGPLENVGVDIAAGGQIAFRVTAQVSSSHRGDLVNRATVHWVSDGTQNGCVPAEVGETNCSGEAQDTDTPSRNADLSILKTDDLAEYDGLAGAVALAGVDANLYAAASGDHAIGVFRRVPPNPAAEESAQRAGLVFVDAVRSGEAGVTGLASVADVIVSGDGGQVYAASPVDNTVVAFARGPGGALAPLDLEQHGVLGVTGLSGARSLALSPDGVHLYAAGNLVNAIAIFRREADPLSADYGRLAFVASVQNAVGGVSGIVQPVAVAVSPDGRHVYVLGSGSVAAFARNTNSGSANYGRLTFVASYTNGGGIVGLDDVRSLAFNADGAHLYVLGATAGTLVHFTRDAESGALSFAERTDQAELAGAARLRLGPDGRTLYAAGAAANAIVSFTLGEGSGVPKMAGIVRDGDPVSPDAEYPLVGGLEGVSDLLPMGEAGTAQGFLYASAAGDGALSAFRTQTSASAPDYLDSMFDGLGGVAPGDTLKYFIWVENHGPSNVDDARVTDVFPSEFQFVSWICVAEAGGATCQSAGENGDIDTGVNLPAGGRVRFEATARVGATAGGRLSNTATVSADGVLDPNPDNNSSTDDDTVLSPRMDLSIELDECPGSAEQPCEDAETAVPGGDVTYRVQAFNAGPSYAGGAIVADALPAAVYDVAWTCEATPQAGLLAAVQAPLVSDGIWRAVAGDSLGRHLYAVGTRDGKGTVALFRRNAQSGVLAEGPAWVEGQASGSSTVRGIAGAADVALSPDGRFLYVAGRDADAVAVFARDAASGALTWLAQVRDGELDVDGIGGVAALAISPDGRHLYAGGASDQAIGIFSISASTGLLGQVGVLRQGQNGVNGLNGVADLAFDAAGTTLFAIAAANRSLSAFRRTVASGALAHAVSIEDGEPGQPVSLQSPTALLVAGARLFVADGEGGVVGELRYEDAGGSAAFELVQELPQAAAPLALAFVQDQARLYVAASGRLRLYSLLPETARLVAEYDGAFSPVLAAPSALLVSPDARHLYATAQAGGIGATLREIGSRCPLAGEGALGVQQVDIAPDGSVEFTVHARIFANASGQLVYSAGVDPRVLAYESDISDNRASDVDLLTPQPDLEISKTRPDGAEFVVAGLPVAYRIDVLNHGVSDALAALIDDQVPLFPDAPGGLLAGSDAWSCAANPPLLEASRIPAALESRIADLAALAQSPDGSRLFGASRSGNALIDMKLAADGSVETVARLLDGDDAGGTAVQGLAGASSVAVSPDGRHLYVTGATSNSVLAFAIREDGLTFLQKLTSGSDGVAGLQGAGYVLVSGDGRHVYTAAVPSSANNSAIALFQRNPETGLLGFDERIQDGLGTFQPDSNVIRGVRRLHLTADGSHLYAVSTVSQSLSRFAVDAGTGRLSYQGVMRGTGTDAVAALAGARDFVATPGDTQFYVLGSGGITRFNRAVNGGLAAVLPGTPLPGPDAGRALALDAYGSRLYLADAAGTVHMYWRNWSDGALELRQSLAASVPAPAEALLHAPPRTDVYLATSGADGALAQFDERAISRCLAAAGDAAGFPLQVDLGVTGWAAVDYAATVHPSARGTLSNTASTAPGDGSDPVPYNNESTDEVPIRVVSDLSIAKTGPATAAAGTQIEYTIVVNNAGPSDALGIHVIDPLADEHFLEAEWTCAASGGSACDAATGAGDTLDASGNLLVGDTLTVTLRVRIDPAYIGEIENGAYVVPEMDATDPTPDDHESAPVVTLIERVADLAVSKSNGTAQTVAGAATSYSITVANLGPSDAPAVRVSDVVPAGLLNAGWICIDDGVADCGVDNGPGSIDQTVSIPAGASLTYTLSATLSPGASGELSNSASAAILAPGSDPVPANNLATDTDTILIQSDVAVSVAAPDRYDPASGLQMPFNVTVVNHGLSNAAGVGLTVNFSHAVWQHDAACTPTTSTQFTCAIGALAAGGSRTFALALSQLPAVPAVLTWSAVASLATPDPLPPNNSASGSIEMATGVDLSVQIDDGRDRLQPGDGTVFTIRITNVGSVDAANARIQAPLAAGYLGGQWQCTPATNVPCGGSGSGGIDDVFGLPAGRTLVYVMAATLDPEIDQNEVGFIEQHVSVAADVSQTDVSTQNNAASDRNAVLNVLFKDGFEQPGSLPAAPQDAPEGDLKAMQQPCCIPAAGRRRGRGRADAQACGMEAWA